MNILTQKWGHVNVGRKRALHTNMQRNRLAHVGAQLVLSLNRTLAEKEFLGWMGMPRTPLNARFPLSPEGGT